MKRCSDAASAKGNKKGKQATGLFALMSADDCRLTARQ